MNNDPSALPEQKLHPSSALFIVWDLAWQKLPALFLLYIQFRFVRWSHWVLVVFGVLLLLSLAGYLGHRLSCRYRLEPTQIVIRQGILFKQQRYLPLANLHNVTLKQNLLHRAFRVAEVQLESAGSTRQSEARLQVLTLAEAKRFETLLQASPKALSTDAKPSMPENNLLPLSRKQLLLYGFISNQGFLWWLALLSFIPDEWLVDWLIGWLPNVQGSANLFLFCGAALVLGKLSTMVLALISHGNFVLSDNATHITVKRGLLTQVQYHIPRHRIQAWRVKQNPFHQWFNHYTLHIDTAMQTGTNQQEGRILLKELVPLADHATLSALLHRWTQQPMQVQRWHKPHPDMVKRIFLRDMVLVGVLWLLLMGGATMDWLPSWLSLPSAFIFLLSMPVLSLYWRQRQYRYAAWAIERGYLYHRTGFAWKQQVLFALQHRQVLCRMQSAFDRRYGMAHLLLDSMGASQSIILRYLPQNHVAQLQSALARP